MRDFARRDALSSAAWAVLAFNLAVIVWGAYVRASGAGAGCGDHWPLCNGVVVPLDASLKTRIEFAHRLTSGIALLMVVGLVAGARRLRPPGHPVRHAAAASLVLMVTEALIGAGLVLFRLVADDTSTARAIALPVHLVNTFALLGALTLTAWLASGRAAPAPREARGSALVSAGMLGGLLLVGITGAIAALGDTLFPSASLADGLIRDLSPTSHVLLRLRGLHPLLAAAAGIGVIAGVLRLSAASPAVRPWRTAVIALVLAQWGAGITNLVLLAPTWLQLVHLLLADVLWVVTVLACIAALGRTAPVAMPVAPGARVPAPVGAR
ncbi:MAG: COX15/CtaA family protein [Gemmatimonadales bacterium]|nr:COX15/CtaA family protein [Gemmatimonadales bacterium]